MIKLVATFNISERENAIKRWVEEGDWLAIGEVLDLNDAYNIELIDEE